VPEEEPVGNRRPLAALVAAILLGVLTAVPGGPIGIDAAFAAASAGRLVVTWRHDAPSALAVGGVAEVERSATNRHRSVVVAKKGEAAAVAARLKADPRVQSVVPDAIGSVVDWPADVPPDDDLYASYQADMRLIGMPSAWQLTLGSPEVIVAVLDTGYEGTHEDLAGIPTVSPYNARTASENVTDGYGHGTHVAGTIAAQTNNATGVAGIAPGVTIMPVKVMDANGYGYWSDFLEGVDWARTNGASIINLSLGSGLTAAQVAAFQPTFTAAWDAGVLVVAAAGNNDNNTPFYPASFANVISVSATNNGDTKAGFSNFGPNVDLSAPGVAITSAFRDNTYRLMGGTSMATPHVVGLAALIRSIHPEYTVAEVETAMKATALDLGAAGRDDIFGYGRIRAPEALAWAPPDITPPAATLAAPLAGASNISESIQPKVAFDEPVSGVDDTSVSLTTGTGAPVAATVTFDELLNRAVVTPASRLASRTSYRVAVGGAIRDAAGNLINPTSFGFTTGDTIAPTLAATHPSKGRTGVARGITIRITFSEQVKGVSGVTLRLRDMRTGNRVPVKVRYDSSTRTATIDPIYRLAASRWYRVRVRGGIEDVAGNNLSRQYFAFKTRP
jgi:subtilisin family serine protease